MHHPCINWHFVGPLATDPLKDWDLTGVKWMTFVSDSSAPGLVHGVVALKEKKRIRFLKKLTKCDDEVHWVPAAFDFKTMYDLLHEQNDPLRVCYEYGTRYDRLRKRSELETSEVLESSEDDEETPITPKAKKRRIIPCIDLTDSSDEQDDATEPDPEISEHNECYAQNPYIDDMASEAEEEEYESE